SNPARHWAQDLQGHISKDQWERAIVTTKKLIKSEVLLEQYRKTLYRWYMVPIRLHKLYPGSPPECWRCGKGEGTVLHIWWQCELVTSFWRNIHCLIRAATGTKLPSTPITSLLLHMPSNIPKGIQKLAFHILLTAQRAIARLWKSQRPPLVAEVCRDIDTQHLYETCYRGVLPLTDTAVEAWRLWEMRGTGDTPDG
ncbi:Hypothetical predicted protein, partial [Pelobates cultripes]